MNDFGAFMAAAATINRFVEFVKPLVAKLNLGEQAYKSVLVVIAVLAGVAVALLGKLNLFAGVGDMNATVGILLTGVLSGLGADVLNAFIDLLYGWRDVVRARAFATRQSGLWDTVHTAEQKKLAA